jgi:hypothetical protein
VTVVADFAGQEGAIAKLKHLIETREFPAPYSLTVDAAAKDKNKITLPLIKALSSDPTLKALGIDVTGVEPADKEISIEPLVEFDDLAVEVRFSDGVDRAATPDDVRVRAKMPVALHERLVHNRKVILAAEVEVTSADGPDASKPLPAVIARKIEGYPITPVPATTLVALAPVQPKRTTFDSIPVKAVYSYDFPLGDYDLVSDKPQWRKKIVVSGPSGDPISADKINLYLKFDLNDKEPANELSHECEVNLPKGFTLVPSQSSDLAVKFKFVKREGRTPP